MNRLKSLMLLAALTALFLWIGQALGGRSGMIMAFGIACVMNVGMYWFSDKIVLKMYNAQPLEESEAPHVYEIVRRIADRANIPMPKIYLLPQEAPNAFATGRNPKNAAVALTTGLMHLVNQDELEGVLAHELSHVLNRDTLISTLAATIAGALSHLSNMAMWGAMMGGRRSENDEGGHPIVALVGIIVAPMIAMLIQMAISRSREFMADESGAKLCGKPLALANALKKIEMWKHQVPPAPNATPATAHLFIINPLSGQSVAKLFSTHPPTEERVERLEAMAHHGL